jgi:hypothetical protein
LIRGNGKPARGDTSMLTPEMNSRFFAATGLLAQNTAITAVELDLRHETRCIERA